MNYLLAVKSNSLTIFIKELGHVYGTPVNDLKEGDTIIVNGGQTIKIIGFESETGHFRRVIFTGGTKLLSKNRIVGRPFDELPEIIKERAQYPLQFESIEQFKDVFRIFPEYKEALRINNLNETFCNLQHHFKGLDDDMRTEIVEKLQLNKNLYL